MTEPYENEVFRMEPTEYSMKIVCMEEDGYMDLGEIAELRNYLNDFLAGRDE